MDYWVIHKIPKSVRITLEGSILTLGNSLYAQVIDVTKGPISLTNHYTNDQLLEDRSDSTHFIINGKPMSLIEDFEFIGSKNIKPGVDIPYKPRKCAVETFPYPAEGDAIKLEYQKENIQATVVYEIYEYMPVLMKRVHITNNSSETITIDKYTAISYCMTQENQEKLYLETDYNGGCMMNNNRKLSVHQSENKIQTTFDMGPSADIKPGEIFKGFRTFQLLHSVNFYEQKMIEIKTMMRHLLPWVNESPLIMHVTSDRSLKVKKTIDDCAAVGFDSVIQSFGSRVNLESTSENYIQRHKKLYDYAHSKRISIGGYTLAVIKNYLPILGPHVNTYERDTFGIKGSIVRCLCTDWSKGYWDSIVNFNKRTGGDLIEIDGPYHFYKCKGGVTHNHKGLEDSRYMQWKESTVEAFARLKELGIHINAPDWMFYSGANKGGIGYEEIAFSKPRKEQLIASRIYGYKGTFDKIPSMGWAFVPLGVYHGGGKRAKFSPLTKNYFDYDWALSQAMISGIIPCFRGKRLFDSEKTKLLVKKWVDFFHKYKKVINGITIHFLPPVFDEDNKERAADIDAIFTVRSDGKIRGILGIYNQTDRVISKEIKIPLFYTGMTDLAMPPQPPRGSGILEVEHPKYGKFPPVYPISEKESSDRKADYSGYADPAQLKHEMIKNLDPSLNEPSERNVILSEYDNNDEIIPITRNGDIIQTISLEPMSYTWFTIKSVDN